MSGAPLTDSALVIGLPVRKIGGDYTFEGHIVSVFPKRNGAIRCVVEDDRGVLHIYSARNLERRAIA